MKRCGIYCISFNGSDKKYIGSSVDLRERKARHLTQLRKQKHNNQIMQKMFNKYGEDSFNFKVIENIDNKNKLVEKEQYYIDKMKPEINILKNAYSTLNYKHSDETKIKLHKINVGKKMTPEQNKKNSQAQKGNKNALGHKMTTSGKEKMVQLKSKKVINKNTNEIVSSIKELSKILDIKYSTLYSKIMKGNIEWRLLNDKS